MADATGPFPLTPAEAARVGEIIAFRAASGDAGSPENYFNNLVANAGLPKLWVLSAYALWTGNPLVDARKLIAWGESRDINPQDERMSTLGSILSTLLDDLGAGQRRTVAAVIVTRRLFLDDALARDLMDKYPLVTTAVEEPPAQPSRDLLAPEPAEDDAELQGFFKPVPDFLDVGFLARALERAPAVCRVEDRRGVELGTGVLLAKKRVLTNQHVVDMLENATDLRVRFGYVTGPAGNDAGGTAFDVAQDRPVLASSPEKEHDFALLAIDGAPDIEPPAVEHSRVPEKGTGLNILQHPRGETMKVAITANGVMRAFRDRGLLHYATRTASGSSGSPCFDDDWAMVALHRAERSRPVGSIREGVLMTAIWDAIKPHL